MGTLPTLPELQSLYKRGAARYTGMWSSALCGCFPDMRGSRGGGGECVVLVFAEVLACLKICHLLLQANGNKWSRVTVRFGKVAEGSDFTSTFLSCVPSEKKALIVYIHLPPLTSGVLLFRIRIQQLRV